MQSEVKATEESARNDSKEGGEKKEYDLIKLSPTKAVEDEEAKGPPDQADAKEADSKEFASNQQVVQH